MTVINASDMYEPALLGEDFMATAGLHLFSPSVQRIPYPFTLFPDNDTEVAEAFFVNSFILAGNEYIPPNRLSQQASIVIVDSDSKSTSYNACSLYAFSSYCRILIINNFVIDTIGFSYKTTSVRENDDVLQITIFSYLSEGSLDDLMLNFSTQSGNATKGESSTGLVWDLLDTRSWTLP